MNGRTNEKIKNTSLERFVQNETKEHLFLYWKEHCFFTAEYMYCYIF